MIIGNTQSVSIQFLFLFFFHQSSLYPIKIFAKYFYLLSTIRSTIRLCCDAVDSFNGSIDNPTGSFESSFENHKRPGLDYRTQ